MLVIVMPARTTRAPQHPRRGIREVKITLISRDHRILTKIAEELRQKALDKGVRVRGPIPLPTRRLIVPIRRSPDGRGTETIDHWEMRIHKRVLYIELTTPEILRDIMKTEFPTEVEVEMRMIER
ncbi:MAG: 30S ribosomal protein S10 [Thermoplasmata archaeon]|nr:MAG: 30S ribosomal protein S10 [Thermoplasmata archaeon]